MSSLVCVLAMRAVVRTLLFSAVDYPQEQHERYGYY